MFDTVDGANMLLIESVVLTGKVKQSDKKSNCNQQQLHEAAKSAVLKAQQY
jgi:hypothetical protein